MYPLLCLSLHCISIQHHYKEVWVKTHLCCLEFTLVHTCDWIHKSVIYKGVFTRRLLKLAISNKGWLPTLLYGHQGLSWRKYRPVSNTAAALLPPWRHPGTATPTTRLRLLADTTTSYLLLGEAGDMDSWVFSIIWIKIKLFQELICYILYYYKLALVSWLKIINKLVINQRIVPLIRLFCIT